MTAIKLTEAQRQLVAKNVALAKFLASRRWRMAPGVLDHEELVSLAYQGLVSAAIRFDPERPDITPGDVENGKAFSGYARQKIIGAILDWQKKDADHVPRSYRSDYKILQRWGYPNQIKKYPELSRLTGLSVARIRLVVAAVDHAPVSFHEILNESGEAHINEPAAVTNVEQTASSHQITDAAADKIEGLPTLHQIVLALRYFEEMSFAKIAEELGLTSQDVKEIHNDAILSVRGAMAEAVSLRN